MYCPLKIRQHINVWNADNKSENSIHPLSVNTLSLLWCHGGFCWSQSQLSLVRAGYTLNKSPAHCKAAMQGADRTSGAICSSLSCSRRLWHVGQLSPELGLPCNLPITSDLPITSWPAHLATAAPVRTLLSENWAQLAIFSSRCHVTH